MSTMVVEIYDALREAGASDEKARAAASSIKDGNETATKSDLVELKHDLTVRLGGMIAAAVVVIGAMIKLL